MECKAIQTEQGEIGVVIHEGRSFSAWGAVVTPDAAAAYLGADGVLTNWQGEPIGTYRVVSTWRTPRSFVSSRMRQVEATIGGVRYTGRSAGVGMLWKGKRVAKQ